MPAQKSGNVVIKEIVYFEKPRRSNMDILIDHVVKKIDTLDVKHVMIAWSSGHTLRRFLEATRNLDLKLNIAVVTNPKGGTMGGRSVSIDNKTREELESMGIKVCYLNDDLNLGEPAAPSPKQQHMREMLLPWIPFHIDPLSLDVGVDLSMLLMFSQGFRVIVGCLVLAVREGLIPEGVDVLCFSGAATAAVLKASSKPRYCYVREILGYERNSDWALMNQKGVKKMVAIIKPETY